MRLEVKADLNVLEVESDEDQLKSWAEVVLTLVCLIPHSPEDCHFPMYHWAVYFILPLCPAKEIEPRPSAATSRM